MVLLFHIVVLVVYLPLCLHNYRSTTRKLHNSNNNSNTQILLPKLFNTFVIISLLINCCYCVMLLLLCFICSCRSTVTIEAQQQHETVIATTTTTHGNVYKLLRVQELIFPIVQYDLPLQQLNVK